MNAIGSKRHRPHFGNDPKGSPVVIPTGRTIGPAIAVAIDPGRHIWVLHLRNYFVDIKPDAEARAARLPPVVEFAPDGHFLRAWGGDDHLPRQGGRAQWPKFEENMVLDGDGAIWIFGSDREHDHAIQKFDSSGKLLLRVGVYGEYGNDESRDRLGTPTAVWHDRERREIFVSDGYRNHRVIAFDAATGAFTRMWGAYGDVPTTEGPKRGFATPVHDISRGPDGLYYVCDRVGNRIQVFDVPQSGAPRFVREISIAPETTFVGSAFAAAFSPCGRFIYVPDGSNERVWVVAIEDGAMLGWSSVNPEEGSDNHYVGANLIHRIAVDDEGSLLIARAQLGVQRWLLKGIW